MDTTILRFQGILVSKQLEFIYFPNKIGLFGKMIYLLL